MKRILFLIMLTFYGLAVVAQSSAKYVNLLPAYPPAVGETQFGNYVYTNSGLYMLDIILDSLPQYEIEHIPDQTVRYFEEGIGFYVKADSLHSSNVVYSYEVNQAPIGSFEFNPTTGRFKFYPDAADYMPFLVTFTASSGLTSLSQVVEFTIMPVVVPENLAIQNLGEMPSTQEYTILAESQTQMFLNNAYRTVHSYSISGKDIVFDNNVQNKVWGLSGREDLYELNLFAERLYIRSALAFPHTNVNIYARELIFEDTENEIASINTTPSAMVTLTYDTGMDGENAGNITLNIKSLKADFAKRFILNGAQGQCSIRTTNNVGNPGNGGNGGVLIAPIDIEQYCDFSRGSAGLKYDGEGGPIIGAGQVGVNGYFEQVNKKYSWIHPYYFAAVIRHINDSYLNNYFSYAKTTANDYNNLINEFESSDEWQDFDATLKVELQDQLIELEGLLYQLNENLDYFGNPVGWAPMLSFEVLLNNYNNEIDRSMPTLYLNYWLQHVNQTMENWVTASQVAASQTQSDIAATQGQINSLVGDIPVLEDKIAVLQNQIEETQIRLEQIKDELLRKATHNVKKKNRLNKAFGIFKAALNCVPVFGGVASSVASAIGTVADYAADYFGVSDTYGYQNALTNTYQSITDFDYSAALGNLQQAISSIDLSNLGQTGHQLKDCYNNLKTAIGPVYNSITNLHQVLASSSAPNDQVQAEFDRLCSESAEYQNIKAEIAALQRNYEEFAATLTQTFVNIVNLTSEVSNEMVTLDALRNDVFQGNSQRDLQAMQCVEKMRQRAMNRLVKYHYYMRKAYEYRLLIPYQGEFSLENMYNRLETMIDQGQVIFDNSTPATPTVYSTLSALFRDEVSGVIEQIMDEYLSSSVEVSAPISIIIPKEWLNALNANEEVFMNLFELGVFSPAEENIRIVDFGVQYMETHVEGNLGYSTYMNLDLEHSGISRFRKNGEVYWFNHISKTMVNPHTWSIRYDAVSNETTNIEPSFASQSLLYSLLNGNSDNMMLFSRPAAWSDIVMSKNVHTLGNADIVIDSLVLRLQYDYTNRPNQIRNIDITTNENLLPYITCSEVDRNGRSNGRGSFHRSYTRSSGTVKFSAMEKHGTYHFVNWTDRLGNIVTENTELTINKLTDQFYRANYERRIPVISVADTKFVGGGGGEYEVHIQNVGLGDIEMDWYVSDSLSTWVHLNGIAEGIDDGYFTFLYETNVNGGVRIDSLEILAPEIEGMSKMIYIVQNNSSYFDVNVSVNPSGAGTVIGAGLYETGHICTLTATPNEGYTFVNWTENGNQVSTGTTYSFTVTCNRYLVANFSESVTPTTNHWIPNSDPYEDYMSVIAVVQIDGVEQTSNTSEIGAFCGEECRGSALAAYFPPTQRYIYQLPVYGNNGDNISFRLYNHATQAELELTSVTELVYSDNGYGSLGNPQVLNFISAITQTTALNNGWNWYSTYIVQTGSDGLTQLEESLGANGMLIKSRTGQMVENYGGTYWWGGLTALDNRQMYEVRTNTACQVSMEGTLSHGNQYPISIAPGWNWIGYVANAPMAIGTAMASITPNADDALKSRSTFSTYFPNWGWYGSLETLQPGQGYKYHSNGTSNLTLTYPTPSNAKGMAKATKSECHFKTDDASQRYNMCVMSSTILDGQELEGDRYELSAFVNGACRGSVRLIHVDPMQRDVAFLTVLGEGEEVVTFRLYDHVTGETYVSNETVTFEADARLGDQGELFPVHFNGNATLDHCMRVYPNPASHGAKLIVETGDDTGIRVEFVNLLGVTVKTVTTPGVIDCDLAPGVYTVRFVKNQETLLVEKLVIK